ncbi:MAG: hypothetical protein E7424_09735 [Ruminococcaceae bacterium]|nr:hypothetical protein [Oscillospiraceae bacterium]
MKARRKLIALTLCASLALSALSGIIPTAKAADSVWRYGLDGALGWNEDTYYTVEKRTTNNNWRQGLASANGEIAFLESGDPNEDVFIFNNTKIVYDDNGIHEAPVLSNIIDEQRQGAINYNRWVWNQAANTYDQNTYGINGGRGMVWSRPYQPAAQYRIKNNDYSAANRTNYNRYTNYETAEVGAQWKDSDGNEWDRRSFASRADDVIVTYIEAPAGKNLDITVSMDHITDMRNEGTLDTLPATDYVVSQEEGTVVGFGTVGKYQTRNITGTKDNGRTLFSYGGWASATRIVAGAGCRIEYDAATRTVAANSGFSVSQAFQANDPKLHITGTDAVMLITKVDRQDDGCNTVDDIRTVLYDRLQGEIRDLVDEKNITCSEAGYQALLLPHKAIHGKMFNNVRIELCQTDAEKADRELTNQRLIQKQNNNKGSINKAFLERVYNNGRYGLICAHGYGSTRLSAIWCGTWNPSWSGDYTLDANTNLQVSGLNTGNMMEAGQGYVNFIVRMVADWEKNAERIYGMTDAILGPPRVDGTGQGQSYHYSDTYPHVFVNGITDWLLLPVFEYWQCYGDQKIVLGKDIDPSRNASVLDWSAEDIARIKADGYYDLVEDVLYPMAMKAMNFWTQFADEKYYTDGQGKRHVNDGTTLSQAVAAGDEDARYIFAPGFSPENSPRTGGASVQALAYNVSMDIAAAHDALFIARTMLERKDPSDPRLAQWDEFEKRIPEYLYQPKTGELKEWASYDLAEAHNHRHESHAYAAWPGYEAQDNEQIREGLAIAMDMRSAAYNGQEATESHGATHKALVEARLKRPVALERVMLYLLTNGYQYSNMLTSHNRSNGSCLCTDSAFGLMGAVNESLLYSNTGVVEILPALLPNMDKGSITGLRARCDTQADMVWDREAKSASVTLITDEESTELRVMCGLEWDKAAADGRTLEQRRDEQGRSYVTVSLQKGKALQIDFALQGGSDKTRDAYGTIKANSFDEAKREFDRTKPDGSIGETRALDWITFKGMDFGEEGSKPRMILTIANDCTDGGLNRDGTRVVQIFTGRPNDGSEPFAEVTVPNTGGAFRSIEAELPSRLLGVHDICIKFEDGGVDLRSIEFFKMPIANVADGGEYSISPKKPLILELNTEQYTFALNDQNVSNGAKIAEEGEWTLVVKKKGGGDVYQTIRFTTVITEANRLLPKNVTAKPGQTVPLAENLNDPSKTLWLAPHNTETFAAGETMTSAPGNSAQIAAPAREGVYELVVTDDKGEVLSRSFAVVRASQSGLADIDFTDPADSDKYEIVAQNQSAVSPGVGLPLICTRNAIETCNGQNSGDQASTPEDLVRIPVSGDWTATLETEFDTNGASNGYYQFFGFYAAASDAYPATDMAGIRGGDGAMQDFIRSNGTLRADTDGVKSSPGFNSSGKTYYLRLQKEGTTYTCFRSDNGQDYTEMFSYEDTGNEAEYIFIDAYTGMTTGYKFTLKSLTFDDGSLPPVVDRTGLDKAVRDAEALREEDWTPDSYAVLKEAVAAAKTVQADDKAAQEAVDKATDAVNAAVAALEPKDDGFLFEDVKDPGKFYFDPVYWAFYAEPQITKGTDDTHFGPDNACTRGHVVTFLWRAAGEPAPKSTQTPFTDLKPGAFYEKAVAWAVEEGITKGLSDTTFGPDATCTRGQIVTFLWRFKGEPAPKSTQTPFTDVNPNGFYMKAVAWAVENDVTKGLSDTAFGPDATCTRGQVVTFLHRATQD